MLTKLGVRLSAVLVKALACRFCPERYGGWGHGASAERKPFFSFVETSYAAACPAPPAALQPTSVAQALDIYHVKALAPRSSMGERGARVPRTPEGVNEMTKYFFVLRRRGSLAARAKWAGALPTRLLTDAVGSRRDPPSAEFCGSWNARADGVTGGLLMRPPHCRLAPAPYNNPLSPLRRPVSDVACCLECPRKLWAGSVRWAVRGAPAGVLCTSNSTTELKHPAADAETAELNLEEII